MGTTLVAIAPVGRRASSSAWVHVGDSRIYLFRDGELEQLTEDHSLVEQWVREGRDLRRRGEVASAAQHPHPGARHRRPTSASTPARVIPYAGDRFLLCSDGLFNEVDESRIESTLRRLADPHEREQRARAASARQRRSRQHHRDRGRRRRRRRRRDDRSRRGRRPERSTGHADKSPAHGFQASRKAARRRRSTASPALARHLASRAVRSSSSSPSSAAAPLPSAIRPREHVLRRVRRRLES